MTGITMPVTKHNYQVRDVAELPEVIAEAFYVAISGRPGPVLIDLPKDVSLAPAESLLAPPRAPLGYAPRFKVDPRQVAAALPLMRAARRPVILAGGGVIQAEAHQELKELAETLGWPVATTLMGLGGFPAGHPLHLGMPGMHGMGWANLALYHSDLILAVGCRLDDRVTGQLASFAPWAKLVHLDVDRSEIGKIMAAAAPIVADARPALKALLAGARAWDSRPDPAPWREEIARWRGRHPLGYRPRPGVILPQEVIEALGRVLDQDTIVATGVGQHQMFTAQYYPFRRPRTFLTSGGLGTMGFGLPAAIGAKLARPDAEVALVDGDGSFLMNIQELATAVRYRVGLLAVVLDNSFLGMVRQWQDLFLEGRRSQTQLHTPPYHVVARAFGGLGKRVIHPEDLEPALAWGREEARRRSLPVVIEVQVAGDENVLPMVPAGAPNHQFLPCTVEERP